MSGALDFTKSFFFGVGKAKQALAHNESDSICYDNVIERLISQPFSFR